MENEFPPNSHSQKEVRPRKRPEQASSEKRVVRQVTKGRVVQRKKPLYKKFLDAFRPEDNVGFLEYTLLEILAPGIKDAVADAVHGTIDNALGTSGSRGYSRRRRDRGSYTSYNRMGSSRRDRGRDRDRDDDRRDRGRDRGRHEHAEIILESRVEATEVLDQMFEILSGYDTVSRRDLLSMVGEPHDFIDEDWGWTDLRGARIHRVSGGYLLDLPRPEPLD